MTELENKESPRKTLEEGIKDLEAVIKAQCVNGNWNHDIYTYGLTNGLILAEAIMKGTEARFLAQPKAFVIDQFKGKGLTPQ